MRAVLPDNPRILVWGLGGAGQRFVRAARRLFPGAEIDAVRERRRTPALREDFSVVTDASPESHLGISRVWTAEELREKRYDVAIIATPTSRHAADCARALGVAGRVLVEKPFATAFAEGRDVLAPVEDPSRVLVHHQRRFHPLLNDLPKLVAEPALGALRRVRVRAISDVRTWHPYEPWRELYAVRADLGGGVLLTECHELDILGVLLGTPSSLKVTGARYLEPGQEIEIAAALELGYAGPSFRCGAEVSLSLFGEPERSMEFEFERGGIFIDLQQGVRRVERIDGPASQLRASATQDELYAASLASLWADEPAEFPRLPSARETLPLLALLERARSMCQASCRRPLNEGAPDGVA